MNARCFENIQRIQNSASTELVNPDALAGTNPKRKSRAFTVPKGWSGGQAQELPQAALDRLGGAVASWFIKDDREAAK